MYFLILNFSTFNFCDTSNRRNVHELIDQSLTINFGQDSSLIIISQSSAHGLVVHVWFVLVEAPEPGHGLAVDQLEDPLLSVCPFDVFRTTLFVLRQALLYFHYVSVTVILTSYLQQFQ